MNNQRVICHLLAEASACLSPQLPSPSLPCNEAKRHRDSWPHIPVLQSPGLRQGQYDGWAQRNSTLSKSVLSRLSLGYTVQITQVWRAKNYGVRQTTS